MFGSNQADLLKSMSGDSGLPCFSTATSKPTSVIDVLVSQNDMTRSFGNALRRYWDPTNPPQTLSQKVLGALGQKRLSEFALSPSRFSPPAPLSTCPALCPTETCVQEALGRCREDKRIYVVLRLGGSQWHEVPQND